MPTLYALKPAFQASLRPLVGRMAASGVTANAVTLLAAALSIAFGLLLAVFPDRPALFLLMPLVLFVRMALNAVDGMLAREHGQVSRLGMYLNELCDVVSDVALILPLSLQPAFAAWGVVAFAFAATLTELAGVLGIPAGAGRVYIGPFGKSDRALALGVVAVMVWLDFGLAASGAWLFPALAALSLVTVVGRIRAGLKSQ